MIRLSATKVELAITESETITSGAQRVFTCVFALSEDWDGLDRTAVFRAGARSVSVRLGDDNAAVVPWEVLRMPGLTLHIGLYGTGPDGLVLPTIWAVVGMIRVGAYPGGDALPPTPNAYDQLVETAKHAEAVAESVRADADAGRFDGKPGPAGPVGPQGAVGPAGPQGEPGKDGAQIDDTVISDTEAWSSRKIVDTLCPPIEETGNPVVCYPVAGYPLGAKAKWDPMQEGSGDPSPENIRPIKGRDGVTVERFGENVIELLSTNDSSAGIKIAVDAEKNITLNGTLARKGNIEIGTCRLHWAAGKTYTMYVKKVGGSASLGSGDGITFAYSLFTTDFVHYFRGDTTSTNLDEYIASNAALTETELIFMLQCWRDGTVFNNYKIQAEVVEGTTAPTTYKPYISQTNTLILPETVYGGEVDAVTGDGKRTWEIIDNYAGETIPREWMSDRDVYSADKNPTVGAQVAYRLVEPVPFTATGAQPIPALAGANTVLTDADSVSVSGRADLIRIIKKTQEK